MTNIHAIVVFGINASLSLVGIPMLQAARAQAVAPALLPYTSCQFADGLQVVQLDSMPAGMTSREVETESGTRKIDMEAGARIMFAYPNSDFYANVKAELLPTASYASEKQSLLDNLAFVAHGNTVNKAIHSPINDLEVHGLDRDKLEGGTLGVYLFFEDKSRVVTTLYLLNQEPAQRKFQSMEEYRAHPR